MSFVVTKELQDTVRKNLHIQEVYVDAQGRWRFIAHKLEDKRNSGNYNLYGMGIYSHSRPINPNVPEDVEFIYIGDPDTQIVEVLSRDYILQYPVVTPESEQEKRDRELNELRAMVLELQKAKPSKKDN